MASPRRSLYILVHLSFLNQLHRPVYDCQETLREMHAFPLDKMLQITALRRSEVAKVILEGIHDIFHIWLPECFIVN